MSTYKVLTKSKINVIITIGYATGIKEWE